MKNLNSKKIIGIAAACILIYLGVQNIGILANAVKFLFGLIVPLTAGFIMALILNVPMSFMESKLWPNSKKKFANVIRRPLALIISIIFILGVIAGVVGLVLPALTDALKLIATSVTETVTKLSNMTEAQIEALPLGKYILKIDWDSLLLKVQDWIKSQGSNIMSSAFGTIGSVFGGIVDAVFAVIFAIYMLTGKEMLKRQAVRLIKAWVPEKIYSRFFHACKTLSRIFRSFVVGQSIEAVILGLLCMLGMFILRIPYAPMVSALVGVTALVPVVGGFIGAIVGAFLILTISPTKAIIFIVYLLILQQIEGNVIYPKVMGNRVNLPAIWILASVTVGGALAGPLGMLLGVPIASTAYVLIREATEKREKKLAK